MWSCGVSHKTQSENFIFRLMTITFTKVKVISFHCGVVTRPQAVESQNTVRETIKMGSLENLIFQTYGLPPFYLYSEKKMIWLTFFKKNFDRFFTLKSAKTRIGIFVSQIRKK